MKINQRKAGIVISYISEIVKILVSIIYTPIMLRLLGQSEYGLYQLVYSVVSYLSLLSLGFGSSYLRFYSRYKTKNDNEGIEKLNGMFLIIFLSISIICVICGIFMVKNMSSIFGTGLTNAEYNTARILVCLLVFNMAITFPNSVFNCCITAHERFLYQKVLILLQNIFNPFLAFPLLIAGFGSIGMVSVTTFLTIVVFFSNMYYCLRKLRIRFCFKSLRFSLLKEMWIFTFFIFLNQIIDQINWSVDKFLLGRLSGTAAVAIYGVGGHINTLYLHFSSSISNVFVPKVNKIVAETNDNKLLTQLFVKVGRIQFIILSLILTGFVFLGFPFIKIWAGEEYRDAYFITILLIVPVTVPLIQNLGIEIQRAKNMHQTRSIVYLLIAIVNVIISIPLIKTMGPIGAAVGTALSLLIGNGVFMNWYYHKYIGLDIVFFWKSILSFIPSLILPCILGICIVTCVTIDNLYTLIPWIILYSLVFGISIYCLGMNDEEKVMINGSIKKVIRFRKK